LPSRPTDAAGINTYLRYLIDATVGTCRESFHDPASGSQRAITETALGAPDAPAYIDRMNAAGGWGLEANDVELLRCPVCRGALALADARVAARIERGVLGCAGCSREFPIDGGVARFVDESQVAGLEAFMRFIYDHLAVLHDPAVHYLLPLLQWSSAESLRAGYLRRLALDALDGRPARILEVGVGSGGNLPLLEAALPAETEVELWGVDLSLGMIAQCQRRLATAGTRRVRLLHADAHALPFPDAAFDRVFHVGGIATYRDPARGLAEMARVARPGTPIVVVDEQLDPSGDYSWLQRLAFRAITFYDAAPTAPRRHLPPGAIDVRAEQVSRFYYCLTFRMPERGGMRPETPRSTPSRSPSR
jgi:ubiquinone/menaquinone biosynthesis C-methylase UbiE/uncharacterized protein YbaR (Trm112 family)